MAVRLAMGASRARLIQQLMTEGMLLATVGTGLGLVVARIMSRLLVSFITTGHDVMFVDLRFDWRVFAFTVVLAAVTCLLFALTPAMRAARTDPGDALKSQGRSASQGRERAGLRRVLVASQIALSLALLVGGASVREEPTKSDIARSGFRSPERFDRGGSFWSGSFAARTCGSSAAKSGSVARDPGRDDVAETTIIPATGAYWNNRSGDRAQSGTCPGVYAVDDWRRLFSNPESSTTSGPADR